ncbi:hypothetical protein J2128_002512 [Methanomicrobium sp. W14]|uniref:hypothetical protein n=1 Tax=Methanomicrobium sp. W14 TaxID=2817839 RepID=UPI001AE9D63F|nr:hypothetical protein [Methanomicrobium sp. W14]MBP2134541.1 hypothetical protein [Methanomicrobium sp. W14]
MAIKKSLVLLTTAFLVCLFAFQPASAVLQEINGMGTIVSVNQDENTIAIDSEYQFVTSYSGSMPISEWIASTIIGNVTGTVPDDAAFETFSVGDPVRFIVLGGDGGTYLGIAKITNISADAVVTDIIGDPDRTVFRPLEGGYMLKTMSVPNCDECSGTTCTASSASVTIIKSSENITQTSLLPGDIYIYNTHNPDEYDISVEFVKGEGLSSTCQTATFQQISGPQTVSVYVIHITKGISDETTVPTESTTPSATQSPGFGIFTVFGAMTTFAVFIAKRH